MRLHSGLAHYTGCDVDRAAYICRQDAIRPEPLCGVEQFGRLLDAARDTERVAEQVEVGLLENASLIAFGGVARFAEITKPQVVGTVGDEMRPGSQRE